jgi:succinate dehydrogenase / fumarate reductase cytochrome b subunit
MPNATRPLSPHLQVYRPQLTAVLSITHRTTGLALSLGTVLLVVWLLAAATGPDAYDRVQSFLGSWLGLLLLFGWSASLFFHLCSGLRHLVWDLGYGFDLPSTYLSGVAVLAGTAALTAIAWIAGLASWSAG